MESLVLDTAKLRALQSAFNEQGGRMILSQFVRSMRVAFADSLPPVSS
jgi:hypothetical protein